MTAVRQPPTVRRSGVKKSICGLVLGFAVLVAAFASPSGGRAVRYVAGAPAAPLVSDAPAAGWQEQATGANLVPSWVRHAAANVTIAIVDTGADLSVPALGGRELQSYDVRTRTTAVSDRAGHGTLVAELAAAAGGDARLLVVKADASDGSIDALDEAAAIRYAVGHGARIVNLSFGSSTTSPIERRAIAYAAAHDVLVVAAAGNEGSVGNAPQYPAALLGRAGAGLAVAASTANGVRAAFSNQGAYVSLAAPGALITAPQTSTGSGYTIASASAASHEVASGTSFAAPQVAGAAALVWAVAPNLRAKQVAAILERTASGHGMRTPALGYGVIDVAAAVAAAGALA
jgi:serine protease